MAMSMTTRFLFCIFLYLDQPLISRHFVSKNWFAVVEFAAVDFQQQNLKAVLILIAIVKSKAPYCLALGRVKYNKIEPKTISGCHLK